MILSTGSPLARRLLADWAKVLPNFVRIAPKSVVAAEAAADDLRLAQPA